VPPQHLITTARAYPGASTNSLTNPSPELNIGLIDCQAKLKSGKTVLERFAMTSLRPAIQSGEQAAAFIVANGNRPAPVIADFRSNAQAGTAMLKYALREVEPKIVAHTQSESFAKLCLNQKACAAVLSKGPLSPEQRKLVEDAAKRYRYVNFATLDVTKVKVDFAEPLNEQDPSYIAAESSKQFVGLENKEPFTWESQPTTQKDVYEAEHQRWPKLLVFRSIPNPVPEHLRPKRDQAKDSTKKKPLASEPVLLSALKVALKDAKQLDGFFASFFGQPHSQRGLIAHSEAAKTWSADIATAPVTSAGVTLYNRQQLARERFEKRKQRAEQRKRQREQLAKEKARLEAMANENKLVEEVTNNNNEGGATATSAFDDGVTASAEGTSTGAAPVEEEEEVIIE